MQLICLTDKKNLKFLINVDLEKIIFKKKKLTSCKKDTYT